MPSDAIFKEKFHHGGMGKYHGIYIYNEITIIPITMVYIKYQWYTISSLEVLELFGGNKI